MFEGSSLSGRTLQVLEEDYAYTPSTPRAYLSLFSSALRVAAEDGGDEHDAAAMFMARLCEMLCHAPDLDPDTRGFIRRNVDMMLASLERMKTETARGLVRDLDRLARDRGA